MPACYDTASPGPPTLDEPEGGAPKYKYGAQPKEKVSRPLDRRAASLLVRERVEKAKKEGITKQNTAPVEGRNSRSPASPKSPKTPKTPKTPRSDDGQLSARSLTKEEKVRLINESANHPYLKRILEGMQVLRSKNENNIRHTHSSQLREQQHKKQAATFAVPPPTLCHPDQIPDDEDPPLTPASATGDVPPPWLLSKHSLLNKTKEQPKQTKKKARKVTRSPTKTPNTARLPERKSDFSPASHQRRPCVDDAKKYPELTELRHSHEDKGREEKEKEEGGGDFASKLQGALTRLASDTSGTDTDASPARSRSSPTPIPAKQLRPKRGRSKGGEEQGKEVKGERTPKGSVTPIGKSPRGNSSEPRERETFSARPVYSPHRSRRPLPSPSREASRSPRPYVGTKPVWRS